MSDWAWPVARYILEEGLPATLLVSGVAVVGSTLIGVVYLTLVWTLSAAFRMLESRLALPEGR